MITNLEKAALKVYLKRKPTENDDKTARDVDTVTHIAKRFNVTPQEVIQAAFNALNVINEIPNKKKRND